MSWYGDVIDDARCEYCGDPFDYCQGHGEMGDPEGFAYLEYVRACWDADSGPLEYEIWVEQGRPDSNV